MTSVEPVTNQPEQVAMEIAVPVRNPPPSAGTGSWGSGLGGCCSDLGSCCLGLFCAPVLACKVSAKMGECCCAGCIGPASLRTKHRIQQGIEGSVCKDNLASCVCLPCVLCQLARELKRNQSQSAST